MPITIEVPELQLSDLPEWCQLRSDAERILEGCRNSLEYRIAIFRAGTGQGRQLAVESNKPTFNSFPPLR